MKIQSPSNTSAAKRLGIERPEQSGNPLLPLFLYCTCDRYNYGDLLFPLITRAVLREYLPDLPCLSYGVVASDMRPYGGDQVAGSVDLFRQAPAGATILIAGGEVLAQSWLDTYLTLVDPDEVKHVWQLRHQRGVAAAEQYCRTALQGVHAWPLILSAADFPNPVRLAYHSVGGWPLFYLDDQQRQQIAGALAKSSFLSVRDKETARLLREGSREKQAMLRVSPDVVSLIAEVWDRKAVKNLAGPPLRTAVEKLGRYICFQCNSHFGGAHTRQIIQQLDELHARTGAPVLLLPLARMTGYDDREFLQQVPARPWLHYCEAPTVQDIAYVVAHSSMFVGTSLHGIVTAVSYEVPAVALATADPKVGFYLASWMSRNEIPCSPLGSAALLAAACLDNPATRAAIQLLSRQLRRRVRTSLELFLQQMWPGRIQQNGESEAPAALEQRQ